MKVRWCCVGCGCSCWRRWTCGWRNCVMWSWTPTSAERSSVCRCTATPRCMSRTASLKWCRSDRISCRWVVGLEVVEAWMSVNMAVFWRCWLGDSKGIRPVKNLSCGGLARGADLHMAQLMPLRLTVSCFSKTQTGFTFLVSAHPGIPGKRAIKHVCVCVCVCFDTLGWASGIESSLQKLSDEMLMWLSVWNEVQIVCVLSSWCHCIPKPHRLLPHLNPHWFYLSVTSLPRLSHKRGH